MIRKYRDYWGVILPRGGGVKRFDTEKAARQFVLACALFEDVWEEAPELSDDAEGSSYEAPTVTPKPEDEAPHGAPEGHIEEED